MLLQHKQNLHTHSEFCDGRSSAREMIESAIALGFDSLGFSEHSPMFYSVSRGMLPHVLPQYAKAIRSLREEYSDRIKIFCGIEYDIFSDIDISDFDYAIGSVHYLKIGDEYVAFDRTADVVKQVVDSYFGGSWIDFAKSYYATVAELYKYGSFDIIGHFDLISKNCERSPFFDVSSKEYLNAATEAIESLSSHIPFFELNTGAIARGHRTSPYPSIPLLKEFKRLGYGVVISSDCHYANMLDCHFDDAAELLRCCGFTEKYILTNKGFVPCKL